MINELDAYRSLKSAIETEFKSNPDPDKNWLKTCDMYKGELEEGAQWKANLPCLFIEFYREDITKYAGAKAHTNEIGINLFIADKNLEEPSILLRKEEIKKFLNAALLKIGEAEKLCRIIYEGSQFHAYIHGLGSAYIMNFKLMIT